DGPLLQELIRGYEALTTDRVVRPAKRNLLAACYRVHGDNFLGIVARLFAARGSARNLLGVIRGTDPDAATRPDLTLVTSDDAPSVALLPGGAVSEPGPAPHSEISKRLSGRNRDNPDTESLFSEEELRGPPARSPTARALDR